MLIKHDLPVNKEETEKCDTLRYSWEKLQVQTSEVQTELLQVQPQFKSELIENVKTFTTDCNDFYGKYDTVSFVWLWYKYIKTSIILYFFLNSKMFSNSLHHHTYWQSSGFLFFETNVSFLY